MIKGQSLFEVVIALGISAVIITALVALVASSIRNTTFSKDKTVAGSLAQEAVEWLRNQRDQSITTFRTNAQGTRCLKILGWSGACQSGDEIIGTKFMREAVFTTSQISGKTVIVATVKVYWSDSQGSREVRSVTNFTDWRER
ncbi:MAG: hypothetical protein AAB535_02925 [Patescibacteria group bacterium]